MCHDLTSETKRLLGWVLLHESRFGLVSALNKDNIDKSWFDSQGGLYNRFWSPAEQNPLSRNVLLTDLHSGIGHEMFYEFRDLQPRTGHARAPLGYSRSSQTSLRRHTDATDTP